MSVVERKDNVERKDKTINLLDRFLELERYSTNLQSSDIVDAGEGKQYRFTINGVVTVTPDMLQGPIGELARKMRRDRITPPSINERGRTRRVCRMTPSGLVQGETRLVRWLPQVWTPFVQDGFVQSDKHIFYGGHYADPYVASALAQHVMNRYRPAVPKAHGRVPDRPNGVREAAESIEAVTETLRRILGDDMVINRKRDGKQASIKGGDRMVRDEFLRFLQSSRVSGCADLAKIFVDPADMLRNTIARTLIAPDPDAEQPTLSERLIKRLKVAVQPGQPPVTVDHPVYRALLREYNGQLPTQCLEIIASATLTPARRAPKRRKRKADTQADAVETSSGLPESAESSESRPRKAPTSRSRARPNDETATMDGVVDGVVDGNAGGVSGVISEGSGDAIVTVAKPAAPVPPAPPPISSGIEEAISFLESAV